MRCERWQKEQCTNEAKFICTYGYLDKQGLIAYVCKPCKKIIKKDPLQILTLNPYKDLKK